MESDRLISEGAINVREKCGEDEVVVMGATSPCWKLGQMVAFFGKMTVEPVLFAYYFGGNMQSTTDTTLLVSAVCSDQMNYTKEVCDGMLTNPAYQAQKEAVQKVVNNWTLLLSILATTPCIFFSMMIGPWSDRYGRRLPLFVPVVGSVVMLLSYVPLLLMTSSFPQPYALLLISLPSVLTGSFVPTMIVMSYISDITTDANRTLKLVFVEGLSILGLPLGSLLAGYIETTYGFLPVYVTAAVIQTMGLIYGLVFMKESRGVGNTDNFKTKLSYLLNFDMFKESFKTCFKERPGNARRLIIALIASDACFQFFLGVRNNTYIYSQLVFDWDQWQFSVYQSSTLSIVLFCTLTVPVVGYFLHISDPTLGILGSLSGILSLIVAGLAASPIVFYVGGFLGIFLGICPPVLRSCISKLVSEDEIGGIFAIALSVESVVPIVSIFCYTRIYNLTIDVFPSCIMFLAGFIFLWPLIVFLYLKLKEDAEQVEDHEAND